MATMQNAASHSALDLPLELCGYEANIAGKVFLLTGSLDINPGRSLERGSYVHRVNIVLADGQILDGWTKLWVVHVNPVI